MKVCIIGKYPPIEGGVSTETFWIARGLAGLGHEVHVVTNALDIEPAYRMEFEPGDDRWYSGPVGEGSVVVHAASPFDRDALSHVPQANPFVSKLAGLATEVVEEHGCDIVFAYYFEPYAVAGVLVATWTGRPLVVKHAGSDLDRLMREPSLAVTYRRVLRSADAVVTQRHLMVRFLGMGVSRDRLVASPPLPVPDIFAPATEPMGVAGGAPPTIGIYGKIGRTKGTLDLVAALGLLAAEERDFELLAMVGAQQGEWLAPAITEAGLSSRTRILSLVPHWRVPSFIRSCTAVCFLERDFPVAIHGPMVPREVLACGTCLVLSAEIAAKQISPQLFDSGKNVVLVTDPKDHDDLAAALRPLVADPAAAAEIGQQGRALSQRLEPKSSFASEWERILARAPGTIEAPAAADLVAPEFLAAVEQERPELAAELVGQPAAHDPFAVALSWCDRVTALAGGTLGAAASYQRLRLEAASDGGEAPATVADGTPRGGQIPVRLAGVRIETFDLDVARMFGHPDGSEDPVRVVFSRAPNLVPRELLVNEATMQLLDACDGRRTTDEVIQAVAQSFGVDETAAEPLVVTALSRLEDADVIGFGGGPSL